MNKYSDRRCLELQNHSRDTFLNRFRELQLKKPFTPQQKKEGFKPITSFKTVEVSPQLRKGSCLWWCPALRAIPLAVIEEGTGEEDDDDAGVTIFDIHRPLFYWELDASRWREMNKRYRLSRTTKRKRVTNEKEC